MPDYPRPNLEGKAGYADCNGPETIPIKSTPTKPVMRLYAILPWFMRIPCGLFYMQRESLTLPSGNNKNNAINNLLSKTPFRHQSY